MKAFDKTEYDLVEDVDVRNIRKGDVLALRGVPKVGLLVRSTNGCTLKIGDSLGDRLHWMRSGRFVSEARAHPLDIVYYYTPKEEKEIDWGSVPQLTKLSLTYAATRYFVAEDPTSPKHVIVSTSRDNIVGKSLHTMLKSSLVLAND